VEKLVNFPACNIYLVSFAPLNPVLVARGAGQPFSNNLFMLSYQQKQFKLFEELEKKYSQGLKPTEIVDKIKDYPNDKRLCLTSVAFLPDGIQRKIIETLIKPLRQADPRHYYFVPESLHITIKNIRVINDPPYFNSHDIEKVRQVFQNVLNNFKPISFELKGLFTMPTSLSIRGYSDKALKDLVLSLDKGLNGAGVPDDKKYASEEIFFGNTNICRYTTTPHEEFITKVNQLKEIEIGQFEVKKINLITTNVACHPAKTKVLSQYRLV